MRVALWLVLALITGCANVETVDSRGGPVGTSKIFKAPYERVAAATLESVQSLNVAIKSSGKDGDGMKILFSKPVSAWSWGEVGKVTVTPVDANATLVAVDSEKRYKIQVTGTEEEEFAQAIFAGIDTALAK